MHIIHDGMSIDYYTTGGAVQAANIRTKMHGRRLYIDVITTK